MPDSGAMRALRASAVARISQYNEELRGARELEARAVAQYRFGRFIYGWEVEHQFSDARRKLHILLDRQFPFSMPRIVLVDRPKFLEWPHVESDGFLCLYPDGTTFEVENPVRVLQTLLAWAIGLVEDCLSGRAFPDFATEFNTYWGYGLPEHAKTCFSLLDLNNQTSREIRVWRGQSGNTVAETPEELALWLCKRFGKEFKGSFERAALIWLDDIPLPARYPSSLRGLLSLAKGRPPVLAELGRSEPESLIVLFASCTSNGNIAAGVVIPGPSQKSMTNTKVNRVRNGFRPGRIPPSLLSARYLERDAPVTRFDVCRVDHDWIHGRDHDSDQVHLKAATVVIAGCGSLGAPVAETLAKSGVGRIVLLDPKKLKWANISRHVLGAEDVTKSKAGTLAANLQTRFPHLSFVAQDASLQSVVSEDEEILNASLVIDATGDWSALFDPMSTREKG